MTSWKFQKQKVKLGFQRYDELQNQLLQIYFYKKIQNRDLP